MDQKTAALFLTNMLERLAVAGGNTAITTLERVAIQTGITALESIGMQLQPSTHSPLKTKIEVQPGLTSATSNEFVTAFTQISGEGPQQTTSKPDESLSPESLRAQEVVLNLDSLQRNTPSVKGAMLCLDFGTAMSKAYASVGVTKHLDLALGSAAGYSGYLLPSTMLIGDDGKLYFGQEALDQSERLSSSKRKRLDSIKTRLSQRRDVLADVDTTPLTPEENPQADLHLTHGDMIRIYLAYFTDVAEKALARHEGFEGDSARHVERRYARPCWPDAEQARLADAKMREMMEHAQILADTFSGQWAGGIALARVKAAIQNVRELGARPSYLVKSGVPEPVAVAAGIVYESENARDAYMVVDVGAGTTDFGLFVATRRADGEVKMHQVAASIQGVMQAGDKVDSLLRAFIAQKEGVDSTDAHGSEVMADLARRIRPLKELLFSVGQLEYTLSDGTVGKVFKDSFLADPKVLSFSKAMEAAFVKALESVSDSYLAWLSRAPMRLNVVVTGGSASLDMMQALSKGVVDVRGHKIERIAMNSRPDWLESESEDLQRIYPQLAVAVGGSSDEIPDTRDAPIDLKR